MKAKIEIDSLVEINQKAGPAPVAQQKIGKIGKVYEIDDDGVFVLFQDESRCFFWYREVDLILPETNKPTEGQTFTEFLSDLTKPSLVDFGGLKTALNEIMEKSNEVHTKMAIENLLNQL